MYKVVQVCPYVTENGLTEERDIYYCRTYQIVGATFLLIDAWGATIEDSAVYTLSATKGNISINPMKINAQLVKECSKTFMQLTKELRNA